LQDPLRQRQQLDAAAGFLAQRLQGNLDFGDIGRRVGLGRQPAPSYLRALGLALRFLQHLDLVALAGARLAQLGLALRELMPQADDLPVLVVAARTGELARRRFDDRGRRQRRSRRRRRRGDAAAEHEQPRGHGEAPGHA